MTQFIQIHALTFYPPSNLNRDDLGRPKTAMVGKANRLRISSQCLKRTWRTSELFKTGIEKNQGKRTKEMGPQKIAEYLETNGISEDDAAEWANLMMSQFAKTEGKVDDRTKKQKSKSRTKQLIHFNDAEQAAIDEVCERIIKGELTLDEKKKPKKGDQDYNFDLLRNEHRSVDVAMFGRMLADHHDYSIDAAIQVSHAFTVNKVDLQDDFFTAVDDLQQAADSGSAHMDEGWFGSGVFYLYLCINRDLLLKNLGGDETLVQQALENLTRAITTLAPSGKQNSFAAHSRCGYAYVEKGDSQPRSLAMAFVKPIRSDDLLSDAVEALETTRKKLDAAYEINNQSGRFYPLAKDSESNLKNLSELASFVAGQSS
jgi:CRISPR system Cascade subunit CasC